jgi:hypothetical protein
MCWEHIQVYYIYCSERPLKEVVFLMCGCEVKYDILPIDFLHINPIYVNRGLVTKGHLSVESFCNLLFTAQVFHKTCDIYTCIYISPSVTFCHGQDDQTDHHFIIEILLKVKSASTDVIISNHGPILGYSPIGVLSKLSYL